MKLWEEFERGKSNEASLDKQIDKQEMVFQALEYEQENKGKKLDLDEFWESTRPKLKDKKLIKLFELLNSRRNSK